MPPPFAARKRGDPQGETHTHVDGVIGHFRIGPGTRTGLHVAPDATQFVVVEAKMYSALSSGTTRAPGYDQAARSVACMAYALAALASYHSLGFWVLAPQEQIDSVVFGCVTEDSIRRRIEERMGRYETDWRQARLDPWYRDWLVPVLQRCAPRCLPWEQVLNALKQAEPDFGAALQEFYRKCVHFNRPLRLAQHGSEPSPDT